MKRTFLTAAAVCSLLCVGATAAEPSNPLVGTWAISEATVWNLEANTIAQPYGAHPTGMLVYTPGGRMVIFLAYEERPTASGTVLTDADRIAQHRTTFAAYAGTYRVDGDQVIHKAATAINPAINGIEQVRYFKIEGEKLTVTVAPFRASGTGVHSMSFLTYKKLE